MSTEAGKAWIENRRQHELWHPIDGRRDELEGVIAAIEAEAAAAEYDRGYNLGREHAMRAARVALRNMIKHHDFGCGCVEYSEPDLHGDLSGRIGHVLGEPQ